VLHGELHEEQLHTLARTVFSNPVVQRYAIDQQIEPPFVPYQQTDTTVEVIPLRVADDDDLREISSKRRLALDLSEMQAIRAYYEQEGRDPTDAELETLAQTWSEHCVHKTFRAKISLTNGSYAGEDGLGGEIDGVDQPEVINGLLKSAIRAATERIAKPWVRSAFVDNAGIIAFDDQWDLAFKVETHNHPSALEPFGGANTGVGGVVRDILGVSARPIANTDILCFGPPDMPANDVPQGVLHPRRIAEGVIHGVEDYGNKMGIPTVNGAIFYHPGYTSNPLVFCGCLGILPHGSHPTQPQTGDLIIVIGGRTGRDGLRGATFSSMEMDQTTSDIAGSAVQIGHPIHEKQVLEVVLRARDEQLYHAITDCGAGGLASAVGEMGRHLGAHVRLETVPLKYPGLRPWEVWLSEAQERMVLAVPPHHWERVQQLANGQNIEAVCIGTFTDTGRLQLVYEDKPVGNIAMDFLHDGIPQRHLQAVWRGHAGCAEPTHRDRLPPTPDPTSYKGLLLGLLAMPNIRSKESTVRRYDHEVQGGTVVKPITGYANNGPSDATVLVPLDYCEQHGEQWASQRDTPPTVKGVALSAGICPTYGERDPYAMAFAAIDEAMRNAVCVGADPDQVSLLDNFCWGNPNLPDRLGSLVRSAQGCYDAAIAYQAPFISGKDSLNNEYLGADGRKHAIPGTLLISALGIVPDIHKTMTMDLKHTDSLLYVIGDTRAELGGSHYALLVNPPVDRLPRCPPQPVPNALDRLRLVHRAINAGLITACHDCSEGGLGVAIAEMCIAGGVGADVDLETIPATMPTAEDVVRDDILLFSESLCRFVVEVRPQHTQAFEALCKETDTPHALIGHVCPSWGEPINRVTLRIHSRNGDELLSATIDELEQAWRGEAAPHREPIKMLSAQDSWLATPATTSPRVLVLHANGTNRDREAALACRLAGGQPEIVHINQLINGERSLLDYQMLVLPGGFSYGDDLGAGSLWALDIRHRLQTDINAFVEQGRPVLGICNGFQTLVKSGLLPGDNESLAVPDLSRPVTLTANERGHFECRWVHLRPKMSPCLFTQGMQDELILCPVAHGEGRFIAFDKNLLTTLHNEHLIALTYADESGIRAPYPANPNGSHANIAGLCNHQGNVLGLMPHPEDHVFPWQHPRWHRGERGMLGLSLFVNGVKAC
jgi:phosphoribosylformylglycinamidine synthase